MERIHSLRVVYQGQKRIAAVLPNDKLVKVFFEEPEAGTYLEGKRNFKDILQDELEQYYMIKYFVTHNGKEYIIDMVSFETGEVMLQEMGDSDSQGECPGEICRLTVPAESLKNIIRKQRNFIRVSYNQATMSPEEFWSEVLETRTYLELK